MLLSSVIVLQLRLCILVQSCGAMAGRAWPANFFSFHLHIVVAACSNLPSIHLIVADQEFRTLLSVDANDASVAQAVTRRVANATSTVGIVQKLTIAMGSPAMWHAITLHFSGA